MMNNLIYAKLSGEPEVHSSARSYLTMLKRNQAYEANVPYDDDEQIEAQTVFLLTPSSARSSSTLLKRSRLLKCTRCGEAKCRKGSGTHDTI